MRLKKKKTLSNYIYNSLVKYYAFLVLKHLAIFVCSYTCIIHCISIYTLGWFFFNNLSSGVFFFVGLRGKPMGYSLCG